MPCARAGRLPGAGTGEPRDAAVHGRCPSQRGRWTVSGRWWRGRRSSRKPGRGLECPMRAGAGTWAGARVQPGVGTEGRWPWCQPAGHQGPGRSIARGGGCRVLPGEIRVQGAASRSGPPSPRWVRLVQPTERLTCTEGGGGRNSPVRTSLRSPPSPPPSSEGTQTISSQVLRPRLSSRLPGPPARPPRPRDPVPRPRKCQQVCVPACGSACTLSRGGPEAKSPAARAPHPQISVSSNF